LAREFLRELSICVDDTTRTAVKAARLLNYFVNKLLAGG
jgi:hypothetical protein